MHNGKGAKLLLTSSSGVVNRLGKQKNKNIVK